VRSVAIVAFPGVGVPLGMWQAALLLGADPAAARLWALAGLVLGVAAGVVELRVRAGGSE